jgi:hypothetical protein
MAKNSSRQWSAEEDKQLLRLIAARYSTKQMAIRLQRPESGVIARLRHLRPHRKKAASVRE